MINNKVVLIIFMTLTVVQPQVSEAAGLGTLLKSIFSRSANTGDEVGDASKKVKKRPDTLKSEMARGSETDPNFRIENAFSEIKAFAGYRGGEMTVASVASKLMRETKAAAVVVAPAGAGKSEFYRHFKHLIDTKDPSVRPLHNYEMLYLDPKSLMGNTSHRGDFEGRLDQLVKYMGDPQNSGKILVIDELEELFKSGDMGLQFLDAMKPYLTSKMPVKLAFGITPGPYRKYMTDAQIVRRIQAVHFNPPSPDVVRLILRGAQKSIEAEDGLRLSADQIEGILRITSRQSRLANPDAALTILENAKNLARTALSHEGLDITRVRSRLKEVTGQIERVEELRAQGFEKAFGPHYDNLLKQWKGDAAKFNAALKAYDEAFADTLALREELEQLIAKRAQSTRTQKSNEDFDIIGDFTPQSIEMDKRIQELSQLIGERTQVLQTLDVSDEQIIHAAIDQLQLDPAVVRTAWEGAQVSTKTVERIERSLYGQHKDIVAAIANSVRVRRAMDGAEQADIPAFLIIGPESGEVDAIARAAAREFTGLDPYRIDASSIHSEANMTRHLGADPGYVGYREGTPGPFLEYTQRANGNVGLVFSNIDQGDDSVRKLLTSILQTKSVSANTGDAVDFSNSLIFTSMKGFDDAARKELSARLANITDEVERQRILKDYILAHQKRDTLSAELLNRVHIIQTENTGSLRLQSAIFDRLNSPDLIRAISDNLEITINYSEELIEGLATVLARQGGDQEINSVIRLHLIPFLQRELDSGNIVAGDVVTMGLSRQGDYQATVAPWAHGNRRQRVVEMTLQRANSDSSEKDEAAQFLKEALRILD